MDNVTHAIFLAFAMFALVLGLSYGIYLMGSMNSVATTLIQSNDATSDYQSVSYDSSDPDIKYTRLVGVDTVISTLYRYNKESFSVEIYSKNGSLHQIFDLTIENVITGESKPENPEWVAYNNLYGENGKECYLFKAPWIVGPEYTKQRIDMYVAGKKAYINGIEVDYTGENGLPGLLNDGKIFEEQFIQYTYDGETISDNSGEDIESITGSSRAQNKIIIRYIQQEES